MQERWINIAKCVAILAVITDHVNGVLYTNSKFAYASYFSVSLFVLLMGVTTYWSFKRSQNEIYKKVVKKVWSILVSYSAAVFIYYAVAFHSFSWIEYKNYWINFNISGPHYYVLLYIQLVLVSPMIFYFLNSIRKNKPKIEHVIEAIFGGPHDNCIGYN